MLKKAKVIIFLLITMLFIPNVKAAYATLSTSSTTVYAGSTVSITLKSYDVMGSYSISSSNTSVLGGGDVSGQTIETGDSYSRTFTYTAKQVGTSTITFNPSSMGIYSTDEYYTQSSSITIKVVKKNTNSNTTIDVNKNYSKNNYLKSLSIDGYELAPTFNRDTLEYSVTLEPGTEKININSTLEDNKASVKGNGEVTVTEGINTLNVVVTAENGNERTYVIKASVDEKDPINVEVNSKKYTVVKKAELISAIDGYTATTVLINKFDIPALYNEVTKVTLVGLKDEEGNISLFSYDSTNGEYKEYREFTFDRMNLYVHKDNKSKYKLVNIKINDKEVPAYELVGIKDYYLLYATNTTTGNVGYYLYDVKENSVQRYDTTMLDKLTEEKDKYLSIVLVLSCVCFLSMLFLLIEVNRDNKRKNEEM